MGTIFISHATEDRDFVEKKILPLFLPPLTTWYAASGIRSAEDWERTILHALEACEWFLLVMSPCSADSEWVKNELFWAMEHRPRHIVPVLIRDCRLEDFHLGMPRIQYVDFRPPISGAAKHRLRATFDAPASPPPAAEGKQTAAGPAGSAPVHVPQFPFHCGFRVPPDFFIGRKDELETARRRIVAGQNFLIVGHPRAGKTSFCWKLMDELEKAGGGSLLACYVNLEQGSQMTIAAFLEHTILNIIGEMARKVYGCRYSDLMRTDPVQACPGLANDPTVPAFVNIFQLVRKITSQPGATPVQPLMLHDFVWFTRELLEMSKKKGCDRFVIFYDEANRLSRDISIELLVNIGEALSQTGLIGCYVASPEMAQLSGDLHSLFGDQIPLGPFQSPEEMQSLLARHYFNDESRSDELPVTADAQRALWGLSGGRPYPIQLLAHRMFGLAAAAQANEVGTEHVKKAYEAARGERPEAFPGS